ncbi:MAG TPA: CDP-alcohol phosphatidyltransferase family protein [Polyangia bacterium]
MALSLANDIRTIPNLITLSRIVLLAVAAALYFGGGNLVLALVIGIVAALTDYLDGAVARATGQVTRLGEILDLFCDLCYESLILTVAVHRGFFPIFILLVYGFREFWVLSIRRYMAMVGKTIPSTIFGKLKTNFLMWGFLPTFVSIAGVLPSWEPYLGYFANFAIWGGLLWGWLSGVQYTRSFVAGYEGSAPVRVPGA